MPALFGARRPVFDPPSPTPWRRVLAYDAGNITLHTDATSITQWTDQVGNAAHAVATTTSGADLVTGGSGIGGQPAGEFKAANLDNYQIQNSQAQFNGVSKICIMCAIEPTSFANAGLVFNALSAASGNRFNLSITQTTGYPQMSSKRTDGDSAITRAGTLPLALSRSFLAAWIDFLLGRYYFQVDAASETGALPTLWASGRGRVENRNSSGLWTLGRVGSSTLNAKIAALRIDTGAIPQGEIEAQRRAWVATYDLPDPRVEILRESAGRNAVYMRPEYTKSFTVASLTGANLAVEAGLVDVETGAETLAPASVGTMTGGRLTFGLDVPEGSHLLVTREAGQSSVSLVRGVDRASVGGRVLAIGTSDIQKWSASAGSPYPVTVPGEPAAFLNLRRHSEAGTHWFYPSQKLTDNVNGPGTGESGTGPTAEGTGGNGLAVFLSAMQEATGYPWAGLWYAVGGSSLTADWLPGTGAEWLEMEATVESAGGPGWDFDAVFISAGTVGADIAASGATIEAAYDAIIAEFRTLTGNPTLPVFIAPIGPCDVGSYTDAGVDAVRQTQLAYLDDNVAADIYPLYSELDTVLADSSHFSAVNYQRFARRAAQNLLDYLGIASNGARGPKITGGTAAAGSNRVTLTVTHDGGTTLKDSSGSTSGTGLSQFGTTILVNGASRTITAAALSAGTIVIDFDGAALSAGQIVGVRHQYGKVPSLTNVVRDDTTPGGSVAWADTVGAPLQPTRGWFEVTAA